MRDVNANYPIGGLILYAWNIDDEAQLAKLIPQIRALNGNPLLCIDEEGGRVSRLANNPKFNVKKYESMAAIGATGDPNNAYECGNTIGTYLKHYGFDIDFAPVADVNTFKAGIKWGCQLIMTAHIGAPNVTGSDIPSTMSSVILQDKLRGELGYQNIIITDGMEMGAITQQYSSAEAAVKSIQAGVDIVLGPKNLVEAFDAVIDAVNKGTISEERINQSVRRILKIRQ